MKKENQDIYEVCRLSVGDTFEHDGQIYQILAPLKHSVITRHLLNNTRECMNLLTLKTKKFKYFEKVIKTGNAYDQNSVKKL